MWRILKRELHDAGVSRVVPVSELGAEDRAYLHETFLTELWPQLTPQSIDSAHPFPFISNKGMGLLLTLVRRSGNEGGGGGGGGGDGEGREARAQDPTQKRSKRKGGGNGGASQQAETRGQPPAQDQLSHAAIPDEMRAILCVYALHPAPFFRRAPQLPKKAHPHARTRTQTTPPPAPAGCCPGR